MKRTVIQCVRQILEDAMARCCVRQYAYRPPNCSQVAAWIPAEQTWSHGATAVAEESAGQHHSRPKSDRARAKLYSTQKQLRLFKMDTMGVDCHPCASKQVQNVRFARREQGLGRADPHMISPD